MTLSRADFRKLVEPLPCGHKPQGEIDIGKPHCTPCAEKLGRLPPVLRERLPTAAEMRTALETCLPCGHPPKSYLNVGKSMCERCYRREQLATMAVKEAEFGLTETLVGSEKQIAYARVIRVQKLQQIETRRAEGSMTPRLLGFLQKLCTEKSAVWFIHIRTVRILKKSPGKKAFTKAVSEYELAHGEVSEEEDL